jgi:hypothetical protein
MLLFALLTSAQAQDVAITEFFSNPNGPEPQAEFIELYNFGSTDVDLTDFVIADEDADFDLIPAGAIIPAGGYLILANDPATFIAEWSVGTEGVDVFAMPTALANSDDEIMLLDPAGGVVWSLAYANDETAGFSTWLTDTAFSVSVFGSQTFPGVDRAGDDNSVPGYLGYESGASTVDPAAVTSYSGDVASPFDGPYGGVVQPAPVLDITGTCPGTVDVRAMELTPNGAVAVLTGSGQGNDVIPAGPCAGVRSDLSGLAFRGLFSANGNGVLSLSPSLGGGVCGAGVQILDVATCTLTNVDLIP